MTLENSTMLVRLSIKDWVPIIGITLTVLSIMIGSFVHHDRLLTQLITQQEMNGKRLDKIENKIEVARN